MTVMLVDTVATAGAFVLVYADAQLLVLNKPSGQLSVPGRGVDKQDCLSARVQAQYPDALVVHRLDMATSGLIVMARSPAVQRALSAAFANRLVHKTYEAVVDGALDVPSDGDWQLIDLPIAVDWPNRPLRTINHATGQPSQTRYRVIPASSVAQGTRLLLEPLTGRTHQLRVHLQAIGHPILGDNLYAPPAILAKAPRLLLHASQLAFMHPTDGRALQFTCTADF